MRKSSYVVLGLLILFLPRVSSAQQADFAWRLGFSGGFSTYYGDLSPVRFSGPFDGEAMRHLLTYNAHYADRPSFRVSLERALSLA
ncbi:OmpA/MotB domain-containing protein [Nitritalea halalkaliphila LW7]|uniref:OmpA/MotB domain-containing protein n=1 Tax=Nitritalea halalkaliphila LW7 TaxID=1189621 RepID=I5C9F4_9BACT|nr:hypothetical protein [Nitritalea halalkaliphila]EIM78456.1 OmpA/MotB domain-containing protein [Nitritalea halalkaliphila LW7]